MKQPRKLLIMLVAIASVLLVIFAAVRGSTEIVLRPLWTTALDELPFKGGPDVPVALVTFPGGLVAVDVQGGTRLLSGAGNIQVYEGRHARWEDDGSNAVIHGRDLGILARMGEGAGFPVLAGDGFAMLSRTLLNLRWYGSDGSPLWTCDLDAPPVGVEADPGTPLVYLYTLDGNLRVVGVDGLAVASWSALPARVQAGFGSTRLAKGALALVGGIDPQTLTLVKLEGTSLETLWTLPLASSWRSDVLVQACGGGKTLLVEQEGELWQVSAAGRLLHRLPSPGRVRKILDVPAMASIVVLRDTLEGSYLDGWNLDGRRLFSIGPSPGISDCSLLGKRTLVIAGDEGIMALGLEER